MELGQLIGAYLNLTHERPEGFTLSRNGALVSAREGYAVSLLVNGRNGTDVFTAAYTVANQPAATAAPLFLGYWRDETGREYVDVSRIIRDRAEAFETARANEQRAVFNFETGQSENV